MRHFLWHLLHPRSSCAPAQPQTSEITDASLCRQLLYDSFQNPEQLAQMVRLPAISEEVAEMEQRAHVARMTNIAPVLPLLLGQSAFMGSASGLAQCVATDTLEHLEQVQAALTNVITASVIASVSTAVALGVLEVNMEVSVEQ